MKNLSLIGLLILALMGLSGLAKATDEATATDETKEKTFEVVVVNEIKMTKADIFTNIQSWFSEQKGKSSLSGIQNFGRAEKPVDFQLFDVQDKDAGLIVGNGKRSLDVDPVFGTRSPFFYRVKVEIKDNKYRITIKDVRLVAANPFTGKQPPITDYTADKQEKARLEFVELIKDMQSYLEKNIGSSF
jgi:hypothetical protein